VISQALDSAGDSDFLFLVGNEEGLSMAHAKGEVRLLLDYSQA